MNDEHSKVLVLWTELCQGVSELQKDLEKNALKQNVSAGIRVRKGLRALRSQASMILKETLAFDKETIKTRQSKKTKPAPK